MSSRLQYDFSGLPELTAADPKGYNYNFKCNGVATSHSGCAPPAVVRTNRRYMHSHSRTRLIPPRVLPQACQEDNVNPNAYYPIGSSQNAQFSVNGNSIVVRVCHQRVDRSAHGLSVSSSLS
jgi:hypothetical protein